MGWGRSIVGPPSHVTDSYWFTRRLMIHRDSESPIPSEQAKFRLTIVACLMASTRQISDSKS